MTNMFKKTLLASALTAATMTASAAELSIFDAGTETGSTLVSTQWLKVNDAFSDGALTRDLHLTFGANYTANDVIKLTFNGSTVDTSTLPASVDVYSDDGDDILGNGTDTQVATLGLISTTTENGDTVAIFRVTDVTGNTLNAIGSFGTLDFDSAEVLAEGGATVSFSAETNTGLALDTGGTNRSIDYIETANQFATYAGGDAFDGTIDVTTTPTGRVNFTSGNGDVGTFTLEAEDDGAGSPVDFTSGLSATLDSQDVVLSGNFEWLLDENGDYDTAILDVSCSTSGVIADGDVTVTASELSFSCPDAADTSFSVTFNTGANDVVIPTQTFTFTSDIAFSGSNTDPATEQLSIDAGEWDLNGSEAYIPYMPYGKNVSQIIYVTNNGTQSGAVSVDYRLEDGTTGSVDLGVEAKPGITKLTGLVLDAIEDATNKNLNPLTGTGSEKVALTVVVNAPSGDIEVYSSYNVNGNDRGYISNSSN